MFINFYSSYILISFFVLYLILGFIFVLFGYFLGLYGFDYFNVNRFFECGFFSNDNILFNNSSVLFDVCFIFLILEFELIFITVFIMYFSFCSFVFFSILFTLLSFIIINDFVLLY
jgi:hypothetical protein